jgi:predicted ATP-grasp superfamily ATP-dependent carboligase
MWSRYATASVLLPDARSAAQAFAERVADEAEGRGVRVIIPTTDAELWALSRFRDLLPQSAVNALPSHDAVARLRDRSVLFELAASLEIPTAPRVRIDSERDREPVLRDMRRADFPVLVWPRVSGETQAHGGEASRPVRARSIAELRRLLYAREDLLDHGVALEPHPGGTRVGWGAVCAEDGDPIAEVFREQLRELRARTGRTTWSRTIEPEPEVRRMSRALVHALKWRGPIFIEWARGENGQLVLVEVVERVWDTVQLAIDAGVDVPLLSYRIAAGETVVLPRRVADAGYSLKWWMGDLERALLLTVGDEATGIRERLRSVRAWLRPKGAGRVRSDVFAADDPLPFAFELQGAARALRRTI